MGIATSYLKNPLSSPMSFSETLKCIYDLLDRVRADFGDFDCIACQGVSGLVMAAPMAVHLKKQLIIVRKPTDFEIRKDFTDWNKRVSHADHKVEGMPDSGLPFSFLVVDDLVSTGETLNRIISDIQDQNSDATPYGIVLYCGSIHFNQLCHVEQSKYPWKKHSRNIFA